MDFVIEIKENDALIVFDNSYQAYLVTVADPTEFSLKIRNAVLKYYKEHNMIEKFNSLKYSGFDYRTYPRTRGFA